MRGRLYDQPLNAVGRKRGDDATPVGRVTRRTDAGLARLQPFCVRNRRHHVDGWIAVRIGGDALDRIAAAKDAVAAVEFLKDIVGEPGRGRDLA